MREKTKHIFEGIGYVTTKSTGVPMFGFPKLINHESNNINTSFFMHVTMIQNPLRKEEAENQPQYFPNTLILEHFRQNPNIKEIPKTWKECSDLHFPISLTYLQMYPGGSGIRQIQFQQKVNKEINQIDPDDWINFASKPSNERVEYFKWRDWHLEYPDLIDGKSSFREGIQDGYLGPIVSFYARQDEINTWFQ